jgi:serine/threonine protein kinase|tara:strand:- start:370 stop:582 length:213 start_codon:yes stop_codon:yes gene_type:complete
MLQQDGAQSSIDALALLLPALEALHASGIVHRDLKPSDVFVTTHGVRLVDFGLAQSVVDDATARVANLTM